MSKPNNNKVITSVDVAQHAGVSQSAVSRCFTPGASISEIKRKKILASAKKLGFRPNALARSLITKQSKIIGVIFSYLSNQYYPTVLELLSNRLQEKGFHILLFMADESTDMDVLLDEIFQYQVDGLILGSITLSSKLADKCADLGTPVVLFNRTADYTNVSSVTSDNINGGYKAAKFLLASGHQEIAYIAGLANSSTSRDRELGLLNGLATEKKTLLAKEQGDYSFSLAREATLRLFDKAKTPDAIFVANDHMALSVIDTIRYELNLTLAKDVSVIGYDDVPQAAWLSYQLTTVRQSARSMVNTTISCLMDKIENNESGESLNSKVTVDGNLIVRRSSRVPNSGNFSEVNGQQTWNP